VTHRALAPGSRSTGRPIPGYPLDSALSRDPDPSYAAASPEHRKARPRIFPIKRDTTGAVLVTLSELKALFFVRDLEGNRTYRDHQVIGSSDRRATGAKRLQITFRDGEQLMALAPTYEGTRPFFYVLPADPNSNNIRILVNRKAVASVVILSAA
jgi:hypothetical protein